MTGRPKFEELRNKTNRQLIQIISKELDVAIHAAGQALQSAENWETAEEFRLKAEQAYGEVSRLISVACGTTDEERNGLEAKLEHLRQMLEALSVIGSPATEDRIAALARALWEARGRPEGLPEDDWFRAERALKHREQAHAACVGS